MLEAPWVGKTPEEYRGVKEFEVSFVMRGKVTITAKTEEEARELFETEYPNFELADYVEETEIEEVD